MGLDFEHHQHKGLNNRSENSHQPTGVREKVIYDRMYEQYLRLYDGTQEVMHRLKSIPHWKP